jgi:CDP-diglyceride synthetase
MKSEVSQRITTSFISGSIFFGAYFISPFLFCGILLLILGYIFVYELPVVLNLKRWIFDSRYPKLVLFILIYPTLPIVSLIYLVKMYYHHSILIPLYPFVMAWGFDTFSYIVGKLVGRHKICPSISPGKTWEGFIGGCGGIILLHRYLFPHLLPGFVLTLALFVSACAFTGDLFESYLKRRANIKDSGDILPGHGGLLDRFDSVFIVALGVVVLDLMLDGGLHSILVF